MQTVSLRLLVLFTTNLDRKHPFTAHECAENAIERWSPYLDLDDYKRLVSCVYGLSKAGLIQAVGEESNGLNHVRSLYVLTEDGHVARRLAVDTLLQILDELTQTIRKDKEFFKALQRNKPKLKRSNLDKHLVKSASVG